MIQLAGYGSGCIFQNFNFLRLSEDHVTRDLPFYMYYFDRSQTVTNVTNKADAMFIPAWQTMLVTWHYEDVEVESDGNFSFTIEAKDPNGKNKIVI